MPQMSPMNWLNLNLFFISIIITMISMIHFFPTVYKFTYLKKISFLNDNKPI